jgi:hypothetical protein
MPHVGSTGFCAGIVTKSEDVSRLWANLAKGAMPRLMVTDPPYGVEYDPERRIREHIRQAFHFAVRDINAKNTADEV